MTSRGQPRGRASGENVYELVDTRVHHVNTEDEREDDIDTAVDTSLLQTYPREDENGDGDQSRFIQPTLLQRLIAIMSLSPLLRHDSTSGDMASYGALPNEASGSSPDVLQSDSLANSSDVVRERERRTSSSTAIRTASFAGARPRQQSYDRASYSTSSLRRASFRSSSPMLIAEPGHPAGQGGHLGGGLPEVLSEASEDQEEADSSDDDDAFDPPDNSPYPQVRASVPATDDTSLSINTPRMWALSLLCAFLGSATNLFFSLRYPSVAITPVIALVVVHPLGRIWDNILKRSDDPAETFKNGDLAMRGKSQKPTSTATFGSKLRLWLAQGKWNEKEHACVYISSNVSFGFAFATDVIVEQSKFYHQDPGIIYQLLLTVSTQILGYAFAGITRRFLVRPPSMIWPGTLMSTAMFTTMHSSENKSANGWVVSRWKFFLFVWSGAFAWYFLPGLLVPALSYFSVITWFAPNNVVIANLVSYLPSKFGFWLMLLVWCFFRLRPFPSDFRLGADCIHRIAFIDAVLGSG